MGRRGLLDALVRGNHVRRMHLPHGPYQLLRDAIQRVLDEEDAVAAKFGDLDLDAKTGSWSLIREVLHASNSTPGIKASKVTKILHRKRPDLVPIFDSRVAGFYRLSPQRPWEFWSVIQSELGQHGP